MKGLQSTCIALAVLMLPAVLIGGPIPATAGDAGANGEPSVDSPENGVVAYYFYTNRRCSTCRKLEAYSEEAITLGFSSQLASGELSWRAVNTDEADNAHFVTDFELVTKSLVLVEYRAGKVVRWENLKLIWQLVREKDGFLTYVRQSTGEFLEES